jgi:hypothetical protein
MKFAAPFAAAAMLVAPIAAAQEPTFAMGTAWPLASNPLVAPRPLFTLGEPTGQPGTLSPYAASTPLRLSLASGVFPIASALPACGTREGNATGNFINGFPVQRYTFVPIGSRLVLSGFSTVGCPIDGAIGGSITYAAPLRPDLFLVAGLGIYGLPRYAPPTLPQRDLRIDLVRKLDHDRTIGIGVGLRGIGLAGLW